MIFSFDFSFQMQFHQNQCISANVSPLVKWHPLTGKGLVRKLLTSSRGCRQERSSRECPVGTELCQAVPGCAGRAAAVPLASLPEPLQDAWLRCARNSERGLQEVKTQTKAGQRGKQQLTTGRRARGLDGQHCHESEHAPSREALQHGEAPGRTFPNQAVLAGNQQRGAPVRAFSSAAVPGHL